MKPATAQRSVNGSCHVDATSMPRSLPKILFRVQSAQDTVRLCSLHTKAATKLPRSLPKNLVPCAVCTRGHRACSLHTTPCACADCTRKLPRSCHVVCPKILFRVQSAQEDTVRVQTAHETRFLGRPQRLQEDCSHVRVHGGFCTCGGYGSRSNGSSSRK